MSTIAETVSEKLMSDESTTVTPGAAVKKSTTFESLASRSRTDAVVSARSRPATSPALLAILTSSRAVKRIRDVASGKTTVVMSRPSATTPAKSEWAANSRAEFFIHSRTRRFCATALTERLMSGSRMYAVTSTSPTATRSRTGSSEIEYGNASSIPAMASSSERSMSRSRAHHVSAR
ncbi:unannotated protein [freshwater metagenome]|uniref:Unannotated protein n=1 Tax=freshwater metagenome TaxID=449393 RepID=A0A6J6JBG5_9ZZZZ